MTQARKRGKNQDISADRRVPFDLQAEEGVLGSVILLPSLMDDLVGVVRADDFYDMAYRSVWEAMVSLVATGKAIDPTLLVDTLRPTWQYAEQVTSVLSKIVNAVPNAAHAKYYAEIVSEKRRLRDVITHCTKALAEAYDQLPSHDVVVSLEANLSSVEHHSISEPITIAEAATSVIDSLETQAGGNPGNKIMTGIYDVDEMIGPILGGEMAIIAARTSLGKTSLAQQVLIRSAKLGKPSLMVSLEMSSRELGMRELCRITLLDSRQLRQGAISHETHASLIEARDKLHGTPFYVWAPPRATVGDIRAACRKLHAKVGLGVVAVDLIGLVAADKDTAKGTRQEQIRAISAGLKSLGKELDVPMIILAQLGREADTEQPRLSHLRDSGRIEEDADLVLLIQPVLDKQRRPQVIGDVFLRNLIVAKHRNGQVGQKTIGWLPMTTTFVNAPAQTEDQY